MKYEKKIIWSVKEIEHEYNLVYEPEHEKAIQEAIKIIEDYEINLIGEE